MKSQKWQFMFNDSILNQKFGPVFVGARRNGRGQWLHGDAVPKFVRDFLLVNKCGAAYHYQGADSCAAFRKEIASDTVVWHDRIKTAALCGPVAIDAPEKLRKPTVPKRVPAIRTLADLCAHFGADSPRGLNRRIYKDTSCGASISVETPDGVWHHNGADWSAIAEITAFTIQSIVEGSDAEVNSDTFVLPARVSDVDHWVKEMEEETERLWHEANDDEDPDESTQ